MSISICILLIYQKSPVLNSKLSFGKEEGRGRGGSCCSAVFLHVYIHIYIRIFIYIYNYVPIYIIQKFSLAKEKVVEDAAVAAVHCFSNVLPRLRGPQ